MYLSLNHIDITDMQCGLIKEAEHIDYEWHDGKMKTRLEYRLLKREWRVHLVKETKY